MEAMVRARHGEETLAFAELSVCGRHSLANHVILSQDVGPWSLLRTETMHDQRIGRWCGRV